MSYLLYNQEILQYFISFQKGESALQRFSIHFKNLDIKSLENQKRKFLVDLCHLFTKKHDYSSNINQNLSIMYIILILYLIFM